MVVVEMMIIIIILLVIRFIVKIGTFQKIAT